ncbi:Flp family type IVb pilin [uncultured Sphingomonas sp.]|uniref:Flp family type IVb pilin n=1 Tax=uncultured Sphingomonas sp. TaxID=158754 RepID=UPI0035CC1968
MNLAALLARPFNAVLRDRRGASAVEYGLIIALIVIAMVAGLQSFAESFIGMWNYIAREVLAKA